MRKKNFWKVLVSKTNILRYILQGHFELKLYFYQKYFYYCNFNLLRHVYNPGIFIL